MPATDQPWDDAWSELRSVAEAYGLDRQAVQAHVDAVRGETSLGRLRLSELVLALACARGNVAAIRKFEDEHLAPTAASLRRLHDDSSFVDEVQQRVRERLLVGQGPRGPRITSFAGRGALGGWVSVTAVRTAMTLLRQSAKTPVAPDGWASSLSLPDTGNEELEFLKRRYRDLFSQALVAAAKALPDRERSVLRMSFAEGLSIDRIAAIYGVDRSTAARWISKAKDLLLQRTHEFLQAKGGIAADELLSLQRLVRSQIETSLTGLFS